MKAKINSRSKLLVENLISKLVKTKFVPKITKPDEGYLYGYISGFECKWRGDSFIIFSLYQCDAKKALFKKYDRPLTRITWDSQDSFSISYFRTSETWHRKYRNLSLNEALSKIENESIFHPPL